MKHGAEVPSSSFMPRLALWLTFIRRHKWFGSADGIIKPELPAHTLGIMIALIGFLNTLFASGVSMLENVTDSWQHQVSAEVSVQVKSTQGADLDTEVRKALKLLKSLPGVIDARALDDADMAGLLAPWLSDELKLEDITLARMIEVSVNQMDPPDFAIMRRELSQTVKGAVLDTHRPWQQHLGGLAALTLSLAYSLLAIVALTGLVIIGFFVSNHIWIDRKTIHILLSIGAEDRYIANLYQAFFIIISLKALLVGTLSAVLVLWAGLNIFEFGSNLRAMVMSREGLGSMIGLFIQTAFFVTFIGLVFVSLVARFSVNRVLST